KENGDDGGKDRCGTDQHPRGTRGYRLFAEGDSHVIDADPDPTEDENPEAIFFSRQAKGNSGPQGVEKKAPRCDQITNQHQMTGGIASLQAGANSGKGGSPDHN